MSCCEDPKIIGVTAKCSDLCHINFPDGTEYDGYVLPDFNIGQGDYIDFNYCLNCGRMMGDFPIKFPLDSDEDE